MQKGLRSLAPRRRIRPRTAQACRAGYALGAATGVSAPRASPTGGWNRTYLSVEGALGAGGHETAPGAYTALQG